MDGERPSGDLDLADAPPASPNGSRSTYGTARAPSKSTWSQRSLGGSVGSASHAVAADPSIAANGACSGNWGTSGEYGASDRAHARVLGDRLVVRAASERVEHQPVGADGLRRGQHGPDVVCSSEPGTNAWRRLESLITSVTAAARARRAARRRQVGRVQQRARRGSSPNAASPASAGGRAVDDRSARAAARRGPGRAPPAGRSVRTSGSCKRDQARRRGANDCTGP